MKELFDENSKFIGELCGSDYIDAKNPFNNPTENRAYNESYADIVPQIVLDGCKLPNIPSDAEKKRIRHFYNIGGGGIVLHFALSFVLANVLRLIVTFIIMYINNVSISELWEETGGFISQYISTSSISPAITILTYLSANLIVFFAGTKLAEIKRSKLFKPKDFNIPKLIQYILIAFFLQYIVGVAINLIQTAMSGSDVYGSANSLTTYYSHKYAALSILYTCIVAPVTEELLHRGFVLKTFSRVSQRFGIFMSAFFFGISHGNIAQFILAFIVGIFMAYIDIKHNSILPSIIVHIAINVLASLPVVIQQYISSAQLVLSVIGYVILGLVIAGFVMFIIFCRNNVFPRNDIRQQFRCRNIVMTSVGTIAAAAIYLVLIIGVTFG